MPNPGLRRVWWAEEALDSPSTQLASGAGPLEKNLQSYIEHSLLDVDMETLNRIGKTGTQNNSPPSPVLSIISGPGRI